MSPQLRCSRPLTKLSKLRTRILQLALARKMSKSTGESRELAGAKKGKGGACLCGSNFDVREFTR